MPDITKEIADAAGKLMRDPAFRAACEKVEAKYTDQWRNSKVMEREEREAAYQRLGALTDVLRSLRSFWEAGEAAETAAARKAKAAGLGL